MNELVCRPQKIAVILGGGGFVGAFMVGVLKALVRLGIPFHKIICVSVGSIIGAGFVENGNKTDKAEEAFYSIQKPKDIFPYSFKGMIWRALKTAPKLEYLLLWRLSKRVTRAVMNIESIYSPEGLVKLIAKNLDARKIVASPQELIVTTTSIRKVNGRWHKSVLFVSNHDAEFIADPVSFLFYIYGSCAIPGALPKIRVARGGEYIWLEDGAYSQPLPILKAIEKLGCDTVIVIKCHSDKLAALLTHKAFQELAEGASTQTARREKEEIRAARRLYPDKNIFVLEPDEIPATVRATAFQPGDFEKLIFAGDKVATAIFGPIAEHFNPGADQPSAKDIS